MDIRTLLKPTKRSETVDVFAAKKILAQHGFEPCLVWGKETGELLVDMVNQEVICRVDDDGRVNTKAVLELLGW